MTDDMTTNDVPGAYPGAGAYPSARGDDHEVEARAAKIEVTREAMTTTVAAIGDRLDPANIVQDAKETVRDATVGKVETMADNMGTMVGDAGSAAQDAGAGFVQTIKDNPIPAAMAGFGLAWLWTHRSDRRRADAWDRRWDDRDAWASSGRTWATSRGTGMAHAGSDQPGIGDRIGDRLGDVTDAVGDRAGDLGATVGRVPDRVGSSAQDVGQRFGQLLDESPLAVGAAAVAIGAAIGMALPSTDMERHVLGPTSERLIGSVGDTASDALEQVRGKVEETTPAR